MRTMQDIAEALSAMKFRKKMFGGVDEADVWKKLEALQQTYQLVYDEQAAYYQALLDERDQGSFPPDGPQIRVVMPMAEPRRIYRTIARAAQQRPPSNAALFGGGRQGNGLAQRSVRCRRCGCRRRLAI